MTHAASMTTIAKAELAAQQFGQSFAHGASTSWTPMTDDQGLTTGDGDQAFDLLLLE